MKSINAISINIITIPAATTALATKNSLMKQIIASYTAVSVSFMCLLIIEFCYVIKPNLGSIVTRIFFS